MEKKDKEINVEIDGVEDHLTIKIDENHEPMIDDEPKTETEEIQSEEAQTDQELNLTELVSSLETTENKDEIEKVHQKIGELEVKNLELEDALKYQVAELRNVIKRRDEKEAKLKKYAATSLGEILIPQLELFKKVLASLETNPNQELRNYLIGFEMIVKNIDNELESVGIMPMQIEIGSQFDPQHQESIEQVETDEYQSGQIVEITNNGYMIHDHVLIHAKVKVAK